MDTREPECWLSEDELERFRENFASIQTVENTTTVDEWQQARAYY